jgi:hypothetical protein
MPSQLTRYQQMAIEAVRHHASGRRSAARAEIEAVLRRKKLDCGLLESALAMMQTGARIALHFHPERISHQGNSVAEGMFADGIYSSQYVTGISSGSPSAFPGGDRDVWEERLFAGAYQAFGSTSAGRPKYGALDVMAHPDGPAPRFGSCYFLLRPDITKRATFTFGGSHEDGATDRTGTLDTIEPVLAPLLRQLDRGSGVFSTTHLSVEDILKRMIENFSTSRRDVSRGPLGRSLDSFIEVQIHGDVDLGEDVEQLVADPAFRDHPVGEVFAALSEKYGISLAWHPGFELSVSAVPDVFRGYPVRRLAERAAERGILNAAALGAAANSARLDPERWRDWASEHDILTAFRRLWHVLVLYGAPLREIR